MMTSTSDNCKDCGDGVCDANNMLQLMSTADNNVSICAVNCDKECDDITDEQDIILSVCANCGKEGANNTCNKCNQVKYCNAVCKKVHKKKHKKDCEEYVRLAKENHNDVIRRAAEKHDEKLFKQPSHYEDCPICFVKIPSLETGRRYKTCCGKMICTGCVYSPVYDNQGNVVADKTCAFCRTPKPDSMEEINEREKKRMELNDPIAMHNLGNYYRDGRNGLPQEYTKALEYWHRAGELGYAKAYCNIGNAYHRGEGIEVDRKKATYYYELAAIAGCVQARYNLGLEEERVGNYDRALKHYTIAVRDGFNDSLKKIKQLYRLGHVTKEEYTKVLQSYQTYLGEIKSTQRDKAAAARGEFYRYY